MVTAVRIGDRQVGPGAPCFVVAEAGVNHNGDLDLALRLVDAAAASGADAVKFQTFRASAVVTVDAPKADYQRETTGTSGSQLEMLSALELPPAAFRRVAAHCLDRGIVFLSSPFDEASADLLADIGVPAIKIGSGEITNLPFLAYLAAIGKPLILSTGMSTLAEVRTAVETLRGAGGRDVVLLHCVSCYPAPSDQINLRAMQALADAIDVPVGYSDHTTGIVVAIAAAALGAAMIEKHFTLDRSLPGPDHRASLEPGELRVLTESIRTATQALGDGVKRPAPCEGAVAAVARRSLVAAVDIPAGAPLTEAAVVARRPGTGLPPSMRHAIVGRIAARDIHAGTLLTLEMVR